MAISCHNWCHSSWIPQSLFLELKIFVQCPSLWDELVWIQHRSTVYLVKFPGGWNAVVVFFGKVLAVIGFALLHGYALNRKETYLILYGTSVVLGRRFSMGHDRTVERHLLQRQFMLCEDKKGLQILSICETNNSPQEFLSSLNTVPAHQL